MMTKMTELNRELLLDELSNFEQKKNGEIPVILNKYLESIAQNGDTMFSWNKLQPLLRRKLELVMNEFNELCPTDHLIPLPNVRPFDFEELKQQILLAIDTFCSAPFTVQRICELITNPSKHYKRTDKFMRGIEKNILVVTTIEPKSADGSNNSTQYSTSSFKNLFSSLHNSSSLSSPSTSLLVNGMSDVLCDQQMGIHCSNESDLHHLSSPVSPNSLPLSTHSSNSPPNPHLAPLQQLDSFTTVFATTPSTPLSVVSDLHTYDHSSSLSLMTSTSGENLLSSEPKLNESYFETNPSPQSETTNTFSNNLINDNKTETSIQSNSSTEGVSSETKLDFNQNVSNESKETESNQNTTHSEVGQQLSQKFTNETITDVSNKSNNTSNEEILEKEEIPLEDIKKSVTSSETSDQTIDNKNESNETVKTDNTSEERLLSDIPLSSEESKTRVEESVNVSENNQMTQNLEINNEIRVTSDEEMSQPMDEFNGNNGNNNTDNNSDMADCSDRTTDLAPDLMDQTLSHSDLSEPMDED